MRIIQTQDGHYIKVIDPSTEGMVGRLYKEIQERRKDTERMLGEYEQQTDQVSKINAQMENMLTRYRKISDILDRLFPEGEPTAHIERPLVVNGSVKANTFLATEKIQPPLAVESQAMVKNLNVEFISGKSLVQISKDVDGQIAIMSTEMSKKLIEQETKNQANFAPKSHVNAGGVGVHPYATTSTAGFMSPVDKTRLDRVDLPAGISIGNTPPSAPRNMQIWIDTN